MEGFVAICNVEGNPVGAGFHVGNKLVFTCAHVFAAGCGCDATAASIPTGTVDCQLPVTGKYYPGKVVKWFPLPTDYLGRSDNCGGAALDIALLYVPGLPNDFPAIRFETMSGGADIRFYAMGFPENSKIAEPARGYIFPSNGAVRHGWSLLISEHPLELSGGFSGAPVTSDSNVLGMVVAYKEVERGGTYSAYMIPATVLHQILEDHSGRSFKEEYRYDVSIAGPPALFALSCSPTIEHPTLPVELGWWLGVARDRLLTVLEHPDPAALHGFLMHIDALCSAEPMLGLQPRRWQRTSVHEGTRDIGSAGWIIDIPKQCNRETAARNVLNFAEQLYEAHGTNAAVVIVAEEAEDVAAALGAAYKSVPIDHLRSIGGYLPLFPAGESANLSCMPPKRVESLVALAERRRKTSYAWKRCEDGELLSSSGPGSLMDQISKALAEGRVHETTVIEFLKACIWEWPALGEKMISAAAVRAAPITRLGFLAAAEAGWPMRAWLSAWTGPVPQDWLTRFPGCTRPILSALKIGLAGRNDRTDLEVLVEAAPPLLGFDSVEMKFLCGELDDSLDTLVNDFPHERAAWWFATLRPVTAIGLKGLTDLPGKYRAILNIADASLAENLRRDHRLTRYVRERGRRITTLTD